MARIRVAALCLIVGCGLTVPAFAQPGTVSGLVRRAGTTVPVVGASLRLCSASGACFSATTNVFGAYSFSVGAGTYYLWTENSSGYIDEIYDNVPCLGPCAFSAAVASGTPLVVTPGAVLSPGNFALEPGGSVAGKIVHAETAAPVSGVHVYLYRFEGNRTLYGYSDVSDGSGAYSIGGLATGTYYLHTSNASGLIDEMYANVQCVAACNYLLLKTSGQPVSVTQGVTTSAINFALEAGGSMSGVVRNSATTAPLAAVTVRAAVPIANSYQIVALASTDGSGQYLIPNLPTGTYYLFTTNSSGFIDELYGGRQCIGSCWDVLAGTPVAVTAGADTPNRNFQLEMGGVISGVVTRAGAMTPLQSVAVQAFIRTPEGVLLHAGSKQTNASGAYAIGQLPTGTYYLFANDVTSVFVNEIYNDIPCAGQCNSETIIQRGAGVAVAAGATTSGRNFALDLGGRIAGTVRSSNGAALADASVYVLTVDASGRPRYVSGASTIASGAYEIGGLPAGGYYAVAQAAGYISEIHADVPCLGVCPENAAATAGDPVAVTPGGNTSGIDFALDAGGRITGMVRNAATADPLEHVFVLAYRSDGSGQPHYVGGSHTNASGAYAIGGLPDGQYYLHTSNGLGFRDQMYPGLNCTAACSHQEVLALGGAISVTVGATSAGRDFALETVTGRIRGAITNRSGAPIANAAVYVFTRASSRYAYAGAGYSDLNGRYEVGPLPPGTYYAVANSWGTFVDEIHPDIPCLTTCEHGVGAVNVGAPIAVASDAVTVNFALSPRPQPRPPGQVTNFTARIADRTVVFAWNLLYDPYFPVDYLLEVGVAPGTTLVSIPVATNIYTAGNVPPGRYFARVRARNAAGLGPPSAEYELAVHADGSGTPDPPVDLVVFHHGGKLEMLWSSPTTGGVATGYLLEVGTSSGLSNVASLPVGPRSHFSYASPVPPGVYFARVRARNAASVSQPSREVMLVIGSVPAPADPPGHIGVHIDPSRRALIGWTPPRGPVLGYLLEVGSAEGRTDVGVFPLAASVTTLQVPGVPPRVYYLRVRAVNAQGTGLPSLDTTFIVP